MAPRVTRSAPDRARQAGQVRVWERRAYAKSSTATSAAPRPTTCGFLTEINVTSPTGIRAIVRLDGPNVAAKIWDVIEKKRSGK
jgi:hypothetical protein